LPAKAARRAIAKPTIFKSLGMAVEDIALSVYRSATVTL
jgi:ornithine cyclodeaminase/alanine dehydrogenase-like protein (mu-crystallin family)